MTKKDTPAVSMPVLGDGATGEPQRAPVVVEVAPEPVEKESKQ